MLLIEAVAGLFFIGLVVAASLFITVIVPKQINRLSYAHSLEGQIEKQEEDIRQQEQLLAELDREILTEQDDNRRLLLESHYYIITKQRELQDIRLRELIQKRDTQRLDRSLERRRRR